MLSTPNCQASPTHLKHSGILSIVIDDVMLKIPTIAHNLGAVQPSV